MNASHYFSSTVYSDVVEKYIVDDVLELYSKTLEMSYRGGDVSTVNGWQSEKDLHEYNEFQKISALILYQSEQVIDKLTGAANIKPFIDAMWFNVNHKNGFNYNHVHACAWYSGCLYLQVPEQSGSIVFTDPRPAAEADHYTNMFLPRSDVRINPIPGTFIMFPSWLPHYVELNKSEDSKVVLCFNIGLKHVRSESY